MKDTPTPGHAKAPRIAVVGSCVTDQIAYTARLPIPGETVEGEAYAEGFGGKGANQAVAAAACGARVFMVSRVGSDTRGKETLDNFKQRGIDATHVATVDGQATGVALILVNLETSQNSIIIVQGANAYITPEVVDNATDVLKTVDSVIMQCEMPIETIYRTIEIAKENSNANHHIATILNVAPPPAGTPLDFQKLNGLDYLVVNETEAAVLLNRTKVSVADAKEAAKALMRKAAIGNVIITLGQDGLVWAERDQTPVALSAYPMERDGRKVVDTTGAGDAFIGSYAVFLGSGWNKIASLQLASLYAGLSATKKGTQRSFADLAEFQKECIAQGLELNLQPQHFCPISADSTFWS